MAFIEDFVEFFETDEFAVEATFAGETVNGIFEESFIEVHGVEGLHPVFTCVQADVSGATHGDAVTIGSVTYHVHGIQKDGTGLVALVLEDQS